MNPYLGEFLGTMLLILLGEGVVAGVVLKGTKSENAGWLTICIAWGLAVALAIYAVGEFSGAHLNPAITIALAGIGEFEWSRVAGYCLAQMGGAFAGAVVVWFFYLPHWKTTPDASTKLAVFSTAPAIRHTLANLLSEVIATAILVFAILFIGLNEFTQGLKPLVVGLLIVSIGLSLGGTTGFAINPARDLGPRIAHAILPIFGKGSSDWGYAWIPVVGPIAGGLLGALLYKSIF
ncbi:MAG: aquaporin family protein [Cyclobacteriaceae bacterium]|nr:aquaporin family protein [Cytophagales bacterium]MBX2898846.1 aquaporin family protein [Cyclobacteriaceae bacterium]